MGDTGDIIVKGGSVEVTFDADAFEKDPKDKKLHKHKHLKITRILVQDAAGKDVFDESDDTGMKFTVRVTTKPA